MMSKSIKNREVDRLSEEVCDLVDGGNIFDTDNSELN
jgi:hypothetical protein